MFSFNIGEFLKKIQNSRSKELVFHAAVQEAIKKFVSIEVPQEAIKFRSGVITIQGISQSAKSAIFIKKEAILEEVNKNQQIYTVKDFR